MILTFVYFHRLKINHDSHEFILESSTVANSYYVLYTMKYPLTLFCTLFFPYELLKIYMFVSLPEFSFLAMVHCTNVQSLKPNYL
jgi:hypothetical protein